MKEFRLNSVNLYNITDIVFETPPLQVCTGKLDPVRFHLKSIKIELYWVSLIV